MRTRPVLVYDGDCGFCTACVNLVRRWLRPPCDITARQWAELEALGVSEERARYEALWVTPDGAVYGGAQAVAKLLSSARGGWAVAGAVLQLAPVRLLAHGVYRAVARNRHRLPGSSAACSVPAGRTPGKE
ncbi:thiol-disulfide oxidoreductase DCC family protein [Streptomyces sp. NPDC056580]|uniref:thiol-disulfide oxidoreductase DCC family protein n=1 Tax=Streptomyces sp. NPDC056580 TaxID=3345872 RepID=UPI00369C8AF3